MNEQIEKTLSKVPHVTFVFWLIKIAATTSVKPAATPYRCR